jgi:hypothetical protein
MTPATALAGHWLNQGYVKAMFSIWARDQRPSPYSDTASSTVYVCTGPGGQETGAFLADLFNRFLQGPGRGPPT